MNRPPTILDWSSSADHWSLAQLPCCHCGAPTNLRDDAARPSHKVCAERVIAIRRHLRAVS